MRGVQGDEKGRKADSSREGEGDGRLWIGSAVQCRLADRRSVNYTH